MGARDGILTAHVVLGVAALLVGPAAMWRRDRRLLAAFQLSVLGVALTAAMLVAFRPEQLWWLWLLAVLSYGLALVGVLAPRDRSPGWLRLAIHGQGGAYISLVTAAIVVSVPGPAQVAAWVLPTAVGVPLLELWYRRATGVQAVRA